MKKKGNLIPIVLMILVITVGLFVCGCQNNESATKTLSDLQKQYGAKSTEELINQFETQLQQYDRTISELTAQAQVLDEKSTEELNKQIETVKTQRDEALAQLDKIKSIRENFFEEALKYLGLEETYKTITGIINLFQ
jgi:uncharacterized protein HemX